MLCAKTPLKRGIFALLLVPAFVLAACQGLEPPAAPREPAIEEVPVPDGLSPPA